MGAELFERIMQLPEDERLDLIEQVLAATTHPPLPADDADLSRRTTLLAMLAQAERDVAAGRVSPARDLLAEFERLP